jgi:CRISPR/Cas system CSM-associated protein Csm3 (group 7 of RAMP superfamily)
MSEPKKLYYAEGEIVVVPRSYWFTSGGEKSSFGYIPHLKDGSGWPIYPDTQLHGDLLMAANWQKRIQGVPGGLIDLVFGVRGNSSASLLHLTDLRLTDESKRRWISKAEPDRKLFSVKPRTAMNDDTRTNDKHMLVNLELADFTDASTGFELRATVYMGYFKDKQKRDEAIDLLRGASSLLSGFGAFRSRGYGRGKIEIDITGKELNLSVEEHGPFLQSCMYGLTALVPMRSKFIEPGQSQFLQSQTYIRGESVRAWFVRTYNDLFNKWPKPEEMAAIIFPDLFPVLQEGNGTVTSCLPSMTTVQIDKHLEDRLDKFDRDEDRRGDQETLFDWKPKPVARNIFVTAGDKPKALQVRTEKRVRNAIDEDFKTITGGLFVQELIPEGISFGGTIRLSGPDPEFMGRAVAILRRVRPSINGTLFDAKIDGEPSSSMPVGKTGPFLVVRPLPYADSFFNLTDDKYRAVPVGSKAKADKAVRAKEANHVTLGTLRRYNTMLQRPRRNRIVIDAGSVVHSDKSGSCLAWKGFSNTLKETIALPALLGKKPPKPAFKQEHPSIEESEIATWAKMSPSQIGQVREILNPLWNREMIRKILEARLEKYNDWKTEKVNEKLIPRDLIERILTCLDEDDPTALDDMRTFVKEVLFRIALRQWEKTGKSKAEKAFKKASEGTKQKEGR